MDAVNEDLLLRTEMYDNIKKQGALSDLAITILSITALSSFQEKNIYFFILVLFVIVTIEARIVGCRNTVYYLSTYLNIRENEKYNNGDQNVILWENRINSFKKYLYGSKENICIRILRVFPFKISFLIRHSVMFIISLYVFFRAVDILPLPSKSENVFCFILLLALVAINTILTLYVFFDKIFISQKYKTAWRRILNAEEPMSHRTDKTTTTNPHTSI